MSIRDILKNKRIIAVILILLGGFLLVTFDYGLHHRRINKMTTYRIIKKAYRWVTKPPAAEAEYGPGFILIDKKKEYPIAKNFYDINENKEFKNSSLVGCWIICGGQYYSDDTLAFLEIKNNGDYKFNVASNLSSEKIQYLNNNLFQDAVKGKEIKGKIKCFNQDDDIHADFYWAACVIGFYTNDMILQRSFALTFFYDFENHCPEYDLYGTPYCDFTIDQPRYFSLVPNDKRIIEYDE